MDFAQGRSQHDALDALSYAFLKKKVNYILDADIRGFFAITSTTVG
jgi:RNA-directed DNA polymerase